MNPTPETTERSGSALPTPAMMGRALKVRRVIADLTLAELARLCGVHQSRISLYERGLRKMGDKMLLRVCAGVGIGPADLARDAERLSRLAEERDKGMRCF